MIDTHIKEKAQLMRREKGSTLAEICKLLCVSKTTAYEWIKDVKLTSSQIKRIRQRTGAAKQIKKFADLRDASYKEGMSVAHEYLSDNFNRDFVVMYLCEGSRRSRWQVAVSNSNPAIILLAYKWMICNSIRIPDFILQIYDDLDVECVISEWCYRIGMKRENIHVTKKSNAGRLAHRKNRCMLGVMQVRISDTYLKCKLNAWMEYMQNSIWNNSLDNIREMK